MDSPSMFGKVGEREKVYITSLFKCNPYLYYLKIAEKWSLVCTNVQIKKLSVNTFFTLVRFWCNKEQCGASPCIYHGA